LNFCIDTANFLSKITWKTYSFIYKKIIFISFC